MGDTKIGFPRYQFSRFDKEQGQYVVRGNDLKEFKLDVDFVNTAIDRLPKTAQESKIDEALNTTMAVCEKVPEHGAMVLGRNGKEYCKPCYIEWAKVNK